jgi:hypothetical protein
MKIFEIFLKSMGKMVEAGARAGVEIFDKLEPDPDKNGPAPLHWRKHKGEARCSPSFTYIDIFTLVCLSAPLAARQVNKERNEEEEDTVEPRLPAVGS